MVREKNFIRIGVSMDKKDYEQLKKISDSEHRPISNQLVFMMKEYIKIKAKWEKLKNE